MTLAVLIFLYTNEVITYILEKPYLAYREKSDKIHALRKTDKEKYTNELTEAMKEVQYAVFYIFDLLYYIFLLGLTFTPYWFMVCIFLMLHYINKFFIAKFASEARMIFNIGKLFSMSAYMYLIINYLEVV